MRLFSQGSKPMPPKRKAALYIIAAAAGILISGVGTSIAKDYGFALNETESLPNWAFMVDKRDKTPVRGEYFVFVAPKNPYYPAGMQFIKVVAGVPGDVVSIKGRDFYINDKFVGHAKTHSKKGEPVQMSAPGVIPAGKYFVMTPHPDSLDSKYQMIGLIDQSRLIGRASPVL